MPTTKAACGRRDQHAPHTETGTMLGAYYSHNCDGLAADPRPDHVLRLTGEQIGSIEPPPEGDWFIDWDEYEDFVPRRMLAEAVRALRTRTTNRGTYVRRRDVLALLEPTDA